MLQEKIRDLEIQLKELKNQLKKCSLIVEYTDGRVYNFTFPSGTINKITWSG